MPLASALTCPGCQTPRVEGPECPRCGIIYARADARAARKAEQERATTTPAAEPWPEEHASEVANRDAPTSAVQRASAAAARDAWASRSTNTPPWLNAATTPDDSEHLHELRLRVVVIPIALVLGYLAATGSMNFIVRLVTMYVHELGHAVTAWLCGIPAIPGPWVTPTGEKRWYWMALLLTAALALWAWTGRRHHRRDWLAGATVLLALQLVCTFGLSLDRAQALISFGGDAGMLVLGTVLMGTFYVRPGSYLHAKGLRWGFVGIGALAFWDAFHLWWSARTDPEAIPFGRIEGVGLSDASTLVETYGWAESDLIRRHVVLGLACLVALTTLYLLTLYRGRAHLRAALRALPFQDG